MFQSVLIANRGEIACRIQRTLKKLGVQSIAVHSQADATAPHVLGADVAVEVGPAPAAQSYLVAERIVAAAIEAGAQAVHPGYGFLSENTAFARACEAAGIAFIGPTPEQIEAFGLKHRARELAAECGVPLVPGSGLLGSEDEAAAEAGRIGYPVMLKSTAGGGGIGMSRCDDEAQVRRAYAQVERLGRNNFGDGGVFLERLIETARHVEVQIFGDGKGKVIDLGERDCSLQRRNQKVVEEAPAPNLPEAVRSAMRAAAVRLGERVAYRSAGTVEFIYDVARREFYFLEVNTRLQVEHGVTEAITGLDLVEWMVRLAAGETLPLDEAPRAPDGHAIEVRLYAEDPAKGFRPCAGLLTEATFPADVRIDGWVSTGTEITPFYDPLIAKLIVHGPTREAAVDKLAAALAATRLAGIQTNLPYLRQIAASPVFRAGEVATRVLGEMTPVSAAIDVIEPGTYTSVQDWPGRVGYWNIGTPPSGPMDDFALRIANRLVGNAAGAAALECTVIGPTLRFRCDSAVAVAGADMQAEIDGEPLPPWTARLVKAGQTLTLGAVKGAGCRTYIAVQGGFQVPDYLGSKSTFALGQFGGHAGRVLRTGDVLDISDAPVDPTALGALPAALVPSYPTEWHIGVMYGPHGAPDFFTDRGLEIFFGTAWEVHYNSNRLGIRLSGPKPEWARPDGGEAGLHPSNIHDCEYAIGSINFTGDLPVILTVDGPSLGGFVCPATIVAAEMCKVGQIKPGDTVRFVPISFEEARALEAAQAAVVETLLPPPPMVLPDIPARAVLRPEGSAIVASLPAMPGRPEVVYRQAGDTYILIEYGPMVLDLDLRFRVHALMQHFTGRPVDGLLELSPGVRSLQVRYDARILSQRAMLDVLIAAEKALPSIDELVLDTRVVRLPMVFDDESCRDAVLRYRRSVRDTAPWLPSNIEFMRRINGLESTEDVRRIVFDASYMVLGLGDVYLGAPCAVPLDPRHRLVTSKYNPARTYTPEGAVGIGGVYMCIYGMDSPGGYQLIGRTVPIWNKFLRNSDFAEGRPWLLRFFDQVRFFPVTEEELAVWRRDFAAGTAHVEIVPERFSVRDYHAFLDANAEDIARFKAEQQAAFDIERERWSQEEPAATIEIEIDGIEIDADVPDGAIIVTTAIPGNLWELVVATGDRIEAGARIAIVESMKMEFPITAPQGGTILELRCAQGRQVSAGQILAVIAP